MPETSMYGSQTLLGPAWVEMDEDELAAAAASFEALAAHLRGVVMPQLQGQMMVLQGDWTGSGSNAAMSEASAIINGHELNAAQASAIAGKLRRMEASVAKVKSLLNATAQQTQQECESIMSGPGFGPEKLAAVQSRVAMGLAQNMSEVTAGTTELGDGLGVPTSGLPGMASAGNPQQAMQMVSQMASKAGQLPQQLGKMGGGGGMQQLMQPMQQLTSMFGKGGGKGGGTPSPFSNHPAAGGTGPRSGAGMARGGMPGGGGGGAARTPLMAKMVGGTTSPVATAPVAGATAGGRVGGGSAPVGAAGGAGGGTGGMMGGGGRGDSGGSRAAMAVPAPLNHDFGDDDDDDDDW